MERNKNSIQRAYDWTLPEQPFSVTQTLKHGILASSFFLSRFNVSFSFRPLSLLMTVSISLFKVPLPTFPTRLLHEHLARSVVPAVVCRWVITRFPSLPRMSFPWSRAFRSRFSYTICLKPVCVRAPRGLGHGSDSLWHGMSPAIACSIADSKQWLGSRLFSSTMQQRLDGSYT